MEPLVVESSSTDACSQSGCAVCSALHLSRRCFPFTLRISLILNKGIKLLFPVVFPTRGAAK